MSNIPKIKIENLYIETSFNDLKIGDLFIQGPHIEDSSIYKKISNDMYISIIGNFTATGNILVSRKIYRVIINDITIILV